VAVASARAERARAVAAEFGIAHALTDYEALLRLPDLDAVSIVTPPHLHAPMALAALAAGKHVLCEKPFAVTVAEADAMGETARRAGLSAMVDFEWRFLPGRRRLGELIAQGYLGEPRLAWVHYASPLVADPIKRPWTWWSEPEKGGGILGGNGSHILDALEVWLGPIAALTARLATSVPSRRLPDREEWRPVRSDDTTSLLLRFAGGATGAVQLCAAAHAGPGTRFRLMGSEGTLYLDEHAVLHGAKGDAPLAPLTAFVPERERRVAAFAHLASAFHAWITTGAPQSPGFADALRSQRLLAAAREAHATGRWVTIS
jgi:predicted dehydrogenase